MRINYKGGLLRVALIGLIFFQSCDTDDPTPIAAGKDGFFVVNEGGFGNGNTSISYYDREKDEMTNNVFSSTNGRPLGDQAQSMTVFEGKGYIVVQNSSKIEVIDADNFNSLATIDEELPSPRYFLGISSTKAYVSDWGIDGITGTIKVVDLSTNTVVKTIATGKGANAMLKVNNVVYVTNAGGFDKDNTIKVIDTATDAITTTITVGDNPNSIQRDAMGNIWIASSGALAYNTDWTIDEANSTPGSISKISANTESLRLPVIEVLYGGPGHLSVSPNGETVYYLYNDGIYAMSISASALPENPIKEKNYYALTVDPFTGNLLATVAPNFSSAGSIDVLDPQGNTLKTMAAGIAPSAFAFK